MNTSIHVTCSGQGVPVVLFHGWGFDSRIWDPVLPMLTQHYQVYCVDLPGFGSSPFTPWDAFKSSVLSQLPDRFGVMGWSLGGLVATRLALDVPEQVTHLVQIASSPCFVEHDRWPGISEAALLDFSKRLQNDPDDVLQSFIRLQLPGREAGTYTKATVEGLQAGLDALLTWDFRERLSLVSCPVLYLFGSRDEIVTLNTMKVMQDRYPQFNYAVLTKAAHALFITHPALFIKLVNDFTSSLDEALA